jgi:hypothetical protein
MATAKTVKTKAVKKAVEEDAVTGNEVTKVDIEIDSSLTGSDSISINAGGKTLPDIRAIATVGAFTATERKAILNERWTTLNHIIYMFRNTIPYQKWADAIAEAINIRERNSAAGAVSAVVVGDGIGHLALNGVLYKLSPANIVAPGKTLEAATRSIREKAKVDAALVIQNAKANEAAILANAQQVRTTAQQELERVRRQNANVPPSWMLETGRPIRWSNVDRRWSIQFNLNIFIKGMDYEFGDNRGQVYRRSFESPRHDSYATNPLKTAVWLSLSGEGTYTFGSLAIDPYCIQLPHISIERACQGVEGLPPRITSSTELTLLARRVEHANSRIQLNSLLTPPKFWLSHIKHQITQEMYDILNGDYYTNMHAMDRQPELAEKVVHEKEKAETFTA